MQHPVYFGLYFLCFSIHQSSGTEGYQKQESKYCANHYGNYSKFSNAVKACDADLNCSAVYSGWCDISNFYLCRSPLHGYSSSIGSCLYAKTGVKLPYLKKPKAFCSGAYGHTIYSLKEAKVQCIADPNCDAIHDEDCLGRYLSLCPSSFLEMTSKASCLHIKQDLGTSKEHIDENYYIEVLENLNIEESSQSENSSDPIYLYAVIILILILIIGLILRLTMFRRKMERGMAPLLE